MLLVPRCDLEAPGNYQPNPRPTNSAQAMKHRDRSDRAVASPGVPGRRADLLHIVIRGFWSPPLVSLE